MSISVKEGGAVARMEALFDTILEETRNVF
jgi:hypothetical protein